MGIPVFLIRDIESGKKPTSVETIEKYARHYRVDSKVLLFFSDLPDSPCDTEFKKSLRHNVLGCLHGFESIALKLIGREEDEEIDMPKDLELQQDINDLREKYQDLADTMQILICKADDIQNSITICHAAMGECIKRLNDPLQEVKHEIHLSPYSETAEP